MNPQQNSLACTRLFLVKFMLLSASLLMVGPALYAADDAARVRALRVPGGLQVLKAELSPDGAIHVLADSKSGPQHVVTRDLGATFSKPISVVDDAARRPGLEFGVWDAAIGKDGRLHVALGTNAWKLKLPKEEWGCFYTSLAPGAKAFIPVRNINHKPSEGFSIAAGNAGSVSVNYLAGKLYSTLSIDGGATFPPAVEPDPTWTPCRCCTTSTAFGRNGGRALLYREETNNERDMWLALWNPAGTGRVTRKRISTTPWKIAACPMTYFSVTPRAEGYLAAWPTMGKVYFARIGKDGTVLPPGEILTPGTNGMRTGVLALSAEDGAALIVWKNNDTLGWQLYSADGVAQEGPGSAPSTGTGAAGVVLANGRFLLFP